MPVKTKMSYAVMLLSLAMLFGASFANADEHEYEPRIDHFKVYRVESVEAGPTVELQGQFDRKPKVAMLQKLTHFANPVSKNGEEILNPNAHLSWYVIEQREGEPIRELDVTNQFGRQRIRTGEARFLLVPTQKKEKNSTFPWGLDHFKCYEVMEGKPLEKEVVLKDQFIEEEAPVGAPVYFCVPVRKYHREEWQKLKNPRDHLTFYEIEPTPLEKIIGVRDQFDERKLQVQERQLLGVPSLKKVPGEEGECVRFESLPLGATYTVGAVFTDSGVTMEGKPFQWSSGTWTSNGYARVENQTLAGGSGHDLQVNNINIDFKFGSPIPGLVLKFGEYGGNLNISVNGDFKNFENFADINGATIGGAVVSVTNGHGNDQGTLFLNGGINKFSIGGQELWIDDVCPVIEQ